MTYLNKAPNGLNTESQALAAALAQIEKQFGKGTIMKLGAGEVISHPGGVHRLGLTLPLGVGGLPRGRVVEIYGPESSARPR
jgi:recombination protein RecA